MLNRVSKGSPSVEVAISLVVVVMVAVGIYSIQHTPSRDDVTVSTILLDSSSLR
jgi:hypothetical protein